MSVGAQAHQLLVASGKWSVRPGLTAAELDALARRFDVVFPENYREFLTRGVPHGPD